MFIDQIKVKCKAGRGGDGIVAWRREKYLPKGGPWGGNGSKGGCVIFQADPQIISLDHFRHIRLLRAQNGGQGGTNRRQGKKGEDLILKVPCGTLIKEAESGEVLCDLTQPDQQWVLCRGGRGGRGNASFQSSTNRAPNHATRGEEGEECAVELELKLLADVGFVGFPNAGKSSLFSALSNVNVKAASYPFTTLQPNLGFIEREDGSRLYLADIPGIIEQAHANRGLGLSFLRHIERTHLLLFILDVSGVEGRHAWDDYQVLRKELKAYNPELLEKPSVIALNKTDTPDAEKEIKAFKKKIKKNTAPLFEISALTGEGIDSLIAFLVRP